MFVCHKRWLYRHTHFYHIRFFMNSTPKISIIVPVYNAAQFLSDCILSILAQDFTNFEVLLVNDGSSDNSAEIGEFYAQHDARVRLINQPNTGVTQARLNGVKQSRSEWIVFVDADDECYPNMLSVLYKHATSRHCDIVKAAIQKSNGRQVIHHEKGIKTGRELAYSFIDDRTYGYLYASIYHRSLFDDAASAMPDASVVVGEDILTNMALALHAEQTLVTADVIYHYRTNQASVMNQNIVHATYWDRFYQAMYRLLQTDRSKTVIPELEKRHLELKIKAFLSPTIPYDKQVFNNIQVQIKENPTIRLKYAFFFRNSVFARILKAVKGLKKRKYRNRTIIY